MEEKYFTLFMWALGTIVALCGVVGSIFQLYIISKFNSLRDRVSKNEGDIGTLQRAGHDCERACERKRKDLKSEILEIVG